MSDTDTHAPAGEVALDASPSPSPRPQRGD